MALVCNLITLTGVLFLPSSTLSCHNHSEALEGSLFFFFFYDAALCWTLGNSQAKTFGLFPVLLQIERFRSKIAWGVRGW